MKKSIYLLLAALLSLQASAQNLTQYVNPFIGSGGHGHVFVGANVPWGLVQLGPTSIPQQWDWCSGYHCSDSTVIGFSHTHLSGTGIGDLFDVTVMPVVGQVKFGRGTADNPESGQWSYQDRAYEVARPGYYATRLRRYDVQVELTAANRVGMHRYTFPEGKQRAVIFDLVNGGCWDKSVQTYIEPVGNHGVQGYRFSTGWAKDQKIYFYAEFAEPFEAITIDSLRYARIDFSAAQRQLLLKVALSPTSMSAARNNMSEVSGWDFNAVRNEADARWNKELARVELHTDDAHGREVFYTALYHTMIAPSTFCNADGSYRLAGRQTKLGNPGYTMLTTYSLWDTYRAAHPLMTLIQSDRMKDIAQTMLTIFDEQGKLPVWHLHGNETDCMVGNPGICVVADAILKGYLTGNDAERGFKAMRASALLDERGLKAYREHGYIPFEDGAESVARTLEYAIADWALAQAARKLGHTADYEYFLNRSKAYRYFFDPKTGFLRARNADNTAFNEPFSPFHSTHRLDDYTEGNAWQYTWLVPHDLDGLVRTFGGKRQFLQKFDSLFVVEGDLGKDASPDITGLIGQYAHGNEPSHHILYFYTMLGQPWKTADLVRRVYSEQYRADFDGLSGNEDVGQMSAWYILSAMGFYQVEPAGGRYVFGAPCFERMDLRVKGGTFSIRTRNLSNKNRYIQRVLLNGRPLKQYWIDFRDIERGGTLEYEMGSQKRKWW